MLCFVVLLDGSEVRRRGVCFDADSVFNRSIFDGIDSDRRKRSAWHWTYDFPINQHRDDYSGGFPSCLREATKCKASFARLNLRILSENLATIDVVIADTDANQVRLLFLGN